MKILVVCQYYYPEPFRITDICEELVKHGHEVQVVTGIPNYPEGVTYEGYGLSKKRDEIINGVKVHRCFTIPRKTGAIYRLLNYYSFAKSAILYVLSKKCRASDGLPFDVVFTNQLSPVMMSEAAIAYKRKYKVPVVMYCLDLWPISLVAGGITKESAIFKYFHHVSGSIYRKMDKVLITSRMFSDYLQKEFKVPESRIHYLPQYAEELFEPLPFKNTDTFDFVFAGNIGSVQSVETIIDAARILKDEKKIRFHIVGDGSELNHLKELAKDLPNVCFYGRKPVEEMPKYYALADAMLVTLKCDDDLSYTLPGKVQSYLATGKPIIGAIDGETNIVIEDARCGFCGPGEDVLSLVNNIFTFINCSNIKTMGENAKRYYDSYFNKNAFFDTLLLAFQQTDYNRKISD